MMIAVVPELFSNIPIISSSGICEKFGQLDSTVNCMTPGARFSMSN